MKVENPIGSPTWAIYHAYIKLTSLDPMLIIPEEQLPKFKKVFYCPTTFSVNESL